MAKQGFRSDGNTPYVYQDTNGSSVAFGIDDSDTLWKLNTAPLENITPGVNANIEIDPSANGDISIRANGLGDINLLSANISTTGGILQADMTTGRVTTTSVGGFVQQVVANGGVAIPVGGSINLFTSGSTVLFDGSGDTLTLGFDGPNNLAMGSSQTGITSASHNTALGLQALDVITDTKDSTALGYHALRANVSGTSNTAIGSLSLLSLNNATNTVGNNTALGSATGFALIDGEYNTLLGSSAAFNYNGSESSNILINSDGVNGESNTLRIGNATGAGNRTLTRAFISGIDGVNVGSVAKVLTMASDQIGTASITAGSGISVTPGANTITIATSGSSVLSTITGNTGGAISPTAGNINVVTANSTAVFAGAGSTETLDFNLSVLAIGSSLPSNTVSLRLVSLGSGACASNVSTADMTGIGYQALASNQNGTGNTAVGSQSLATLNNTVGLGHNTAIGQGACAALTGGSFNTVLGSSTAGNYTGSENNNVCINSDGVTGDANVLRIGSRAAAQFTLAKAFIGGIDGVNVGSTAKVVTLGSGGTNDQLGTATVTAGTGISVTPGANTITIASTALFTWNTVSGTSASMAVSNGYIANNAGLVTLTLPSTAAVGDTIKIMYKGAGGWKIAQNAGQTIFFGSTNTTTGVGGSLQNSQVGDGIELVCITANNDWRNVVGSQGNITVV